MRQLPVAVVTANPGTVSDIAVHDNPETNGVRVSFELDPGGTELSRATFGAEAWRSADLRDLALSMDEIMSELTVAGQKIGRIPDASSPELLPAGSSRSKCPIRISRRARRPSRGAAAAIGCRAPRCLPGPGLLTAAFAYELYGVLAVEQATPLQLLFLILSTIAFGWIALGSLNAALGFIPLFGGEKADTIDLPPPGAPLTSAYRAAVPRLPRGSRAHRRHRAGDRAGAGIDGQRCGVRRLPAVRHAR